MRRGFPEGSENARDYAPLGVRPCKEVGGGNFFLRGRNPTKLRETLQHNILGGSDAVLLWKRRKIRLQLQFFLSAVWELFTVMFCLFLQDIVLLE